ncbi:hypothetical protein CsSME_00030727 [Camellia sinensis var. sinensis]
MVLQIVILMNMLLIAIILPLPPSSLVIKHVVIPKCFMALQRVLVVSGGGVVSFATIQLAVAAEYHVSTTCGSESIDRAMAAGTKQAVDYTTQDIESALKGQFDVVLDTIGVLETERTGINGEAASLTDRYVLAIGLPIASKEKLETENLKLEIVEVCFDYFPAVYAWKCFYNSFS